MTAEARGSIRAALAAAVGAGLAVAPVVVAAAVRVDIRAVTADEDVAPAAEPLLVKVVLRNPEAQRWRVSDRDREDARAALEALPVFATLPPEARQRAAEDLGPQPEPATELGSAARPIAQLVAVELRRADGEAVPGAVRALAANDALPASVRLDADTSPLLLFGLDAETTARLAPGRYTLRATLAADGEPVVAETDLELQASAPAATPAARAEREERAARFYLWDADYPRGEALARSRLEVDSDSWVAADLLGDALAGQGDRDGAIDAYERALEAYEARAEAARDQLPSLVPEGAPVPEWEELRSVRSKLLALRYGVEAR